MKFILTGGGDSENFHEIDSRFISLLGESPRLLFIPLAGEESSWVSALERIRDVFSTIEFNKIEACVDLSALDWAYLKSFDAIYFDGGNTFNLMEQIRDTHTYELLHKFIHRGGVINGDSAGAIVLGSHLETAHFGAEGDENDSEVTSYQGLNLLGRWAIHCHYNESEDEEIRSFSLEYGFPIIALYEDSSVLIDSGNLEVIGKQDVKIFTQADTRLLRPGDFFSLK